MLAAYQQDYRQNSLSVHFVAPAIVVVGGVMIQSCHLEIRPSLVVVFASGAVETEGGRLRQVVGIVVESKVGMM